MDVLASWRAKISILTIVKLENGHGHFQTWIPKISHPQPSNAQNSIFILTCKKNLSTKDNILVEQEGIEHIVQTHCS